MASMRFSAASARAVVSCSVKSMGIDFRVIRIRLWHRLFRLYWQTAEAQLKLIKRAIGWIGTEDKAGAAELEARVQGLAQQTKKNQELALYTSIGHALCHWAAMEDHFIKACAI